MLDQAKAGSGAATDMAFAEKLGVTRQAVSTWRKGNAYPDAVSCEKIAVFSGIPLNQVLGIVGEARAISEQEKRVWRKLAAAMFVALVITLPTAAASKLPTNGQSLCTLCEVLARMRRDIARHFVTLARRYGERHEPLPAL